MTGKHSKLIKSLNQRLGKCMNTIRFVCEHDYFTGRVLPIIEDSLRPLFVLMTNPKDVDFDDDMVFCAYALIKKTKTCSLMMQEFFPYLQMFQNKYEGMLANLTNCLNAYIVYGQDFID